MNVMGTINNVGAALKQGLQKYGTTVGGAGEMAMAKVNPIELLSSKGAFSPTIEAARSFIMNNPKIFSAMPNLQDIAGDPSGNSQNLISTYNKVKSGSGTDADKQMLNSNGQEAMANQIVALGIGGVQGIDPANEAQLTDLLRSGKGTYDAPSGLVKMKDSAGNSLNAGKLSKSMATEALSKVRSLIK